MTNYRIGTAFLALTTALVGGAASAAPALASTAPVAATSPDAAAPADLIPVNFVDLPMRDLPAPGESHTFVVSYRNDTTADQVVAPQIMVESPDAGPFLTSADIKIEQRSADGSRKALPVGSQTGTLYTDLETAQRTLHPGETLTERYRVTAITPGAAGTVHPRVALYG